VKNKKCQKIGLDVILSESLSKSPLRRTSSGQQDRHCEALDSADTRVGLVHEGGKPIYYDRCQIKAGSRRSKLTAERSRASQPDIGLTGPQATA
jgi:hypothetical protein